MALVETPFENPNAYDSIRVNGTDTPGLCTFKGGGNRKKKIEDQQGIGFEGAFTVHRGEEIPTVEYEFHVWTNEDYKALQKLAEEWRAAQRSRPPKILTLVDLAIAHNKINRVEVMDLGAFQSSKIGRWMLPVVFKEWRKRKPIAPLPQPPKSDVDRDLEQFTKDNARIDQQLEAMKVAADRGEYQGGSPSSIAGFFGL